MATFALTVPSFLTHFIAGHVLLHHYYHSNIAGHVLLHHYSHSNIAGHVLLHHYYHSNIAGHVLLHHYYHSNIAGHVLLHHYYHTNIKIFLLLSNSFLSPLNAELNPICHLLAFFGSHHILHISRIRVNPSFCCPVASTSAESYKLHFPNCIQF